MRTPKLDSPWYEKGIVVAIALLFLFPLGLILMWASKVWPPFVRSIITAVFGLVAVFVIIAIEPRDQESQTVVNPCELGYGKALKIAEERIDGLYQGAAWVADGYGIATEGERTFAFLIYAVGEKCCVMMVQCGEVAAVDCGNVSVKYQEFKNLVITSNATGAVFASHKEYQAGRLATAPGGISLPDHEKTSNRQEAPANAKAEPLGFDGATNVILADVLGHWVAESNDCESEGGLWIYLDGDSTTIGGQEWHGAVLSSKQDKDRTHVTLRTVEEGMEGTMEIQLGIRQGRLVLNPEFGYYCCGDRAAMLRRCP